MQEVQRNFRALPTTVVLVQILLVIQALVDAVLVGLILTVPGSSAEPLLEIGGATIGFFLALFLAWKLGQKRRWAYVTTLVVAIVSAFSTTALILISSVPHVIQLTNLTLLVLEVSQVALLASGSARRAFAK